MKKVVENHDIFCNLKGTNPVVAFEVFEMDGINAVAKQ